MPIFVLGLVLQYLFAVTLKDTVLALPPSGRLSPGLVPRRSTSSGASAATAIEFISQLRDPQRAPAVELAARRRRRPASDPAGDRRRHDPLGDHRPDDAVEPARCPRSGLRAHGQGQGLRRAQVVRATPCAVPCFRSTVVGLSARRPVRWAILTETIFSLTGVGKTLYDSITARDYAVVQGFALIVGVSFVFVNLITDLLYTVSDPRVRVLVSCAPRRRASRASQRRNWQTVAGGGGPDHRTLVLSPIVGAMRRAEPLWSADRSGARHADHRHGRARAVIAPYDPPRYSSTRPPTRASWSGPASTGSAATSRRSST